MSFIDKINRFATNPVNLNHKRSKFNLSHKISTSLESGVLIPLMVDEVLPGDSIKIDLSTVVRSITPALPVMDNAYLDVYAFSCPARILTVHDKDWQKIHGENIAGSWAPTTEATLSNTGNTFKISYSVNPQSLADYMGFPIGFSHSTQEFSRLPFNGYWEIWNEFFRDQNTQVRVDWKSFTNANMNSYVTASVPGLNNIKRVNKFHDYFTSALNSPQKGNSVLLPLGSSAPVITGTDHHTTFQGTVGVNTVQSGTGGNSDTTYNLGNRLGAKPQGWLTGLTGSASTGTPATNYIQFTNLWADLSAATAASVNDLRQAFAIQKLLEKDARGGTRYREMLLSHYGVSIPDNTVQVPEYLGGKRIPLNMVQVIQTSENNNSPLGTTGAFSNTSDNSYLFTKSFAEFCYIYILVCIRPNQSYCQGINKLWTRNRRYDFYYPVFANLGEQAVKTTELYATNASDFDEVFGYQEAWAEYRYKPSKITGYLSKLSGDTVAGAWTYVNYFTAKPVLNSSFMSQDSTQIGNTLAVVNSNYQFVLDAWVNYTAWREMPYFSIPGLIDHH